MLNFCDFILVYVFTTNHHLKIEICGLLGVFSLFSFFYGGGEVLILNKDL